MQIITTINTGLQRYSFKQFQGMDHRIQMGLYDIKNLEQITTDRSIMAFEKSLEPESINLIVDSLPRCFRFLYLPSIFAISIPSI